MERIKVYFFLMVGVLLFYGCKKPMLNLGNGEFNSFHFNDYLTSLDRGENDTLLLGTASGKLIFFDPGSSANHSWPVGEERVYFSYQHSSGLFVGVRNEGLKRYSQDGCTMKQYKLAQKNFHYSVYMVEQYGDTLFCATSSGLCFLNLKKESDSLTPIYPGEYKDSVPDDFKISIIKCIQDTLYAVWMGDTTTKLLAFPISDINGAPKDKSSDIINSLYADSDFKNRTLCLIRNDYVVFGKDSFPNKEEAFKSFFYNKHADYPFLFASSERFVAADQLCPANTKQKFLLTLPDKSHAETSKIINQGGYSYWVTGKTLCAIPDHISKSTQITALSQWGNVVVVIDKDNAIYEDKNTEGQYKFDFRISGLENKKVEKIEMLSEKDMCVLSDGSVFFGSKGKRFKNIGDLGKNFIHLKNEKVHQIHYDSTQSRLFLAYRKGYAFCNIKNGKIQLDDSLSYENSTKSAQCVYCIDSSTVYIGTLNDGCMKREIINGKFTDHVEVINNHYNIIDITKIDSDYYYLTPAKLYRDTSLVTDNKSRYIQKIYPIHKNIVGISRTGGIYLIDTKLDSVSGPFFTDIYFYPNAIIVHDDSTLIAGTNIGILRIKVDSLVTIAHNENIKMSLATRISNSIQEQIDNIVLFGLPAALILLGILVTLSVLIFISNKKKNKLSKEKDDLAKAKESLTKTNENLATEQKDLVEAKIDLTRDLNELKKDREEEIRSLQYNFLLTIPNDESNSEYFKRYCSLIAPIKKRIGEIDLTSGNFQDSVKAVRTELVSSPLLRAALNLEIENMHEWYKKNTPFENSDNLDVFKNKIEGICEKYLDRVVDFTVHFRNIKNDKKQYYLTIIALCLFTDKTNLSKLLNNQHLSILFSPDCQNTGDNESVKRKLNYFSTLKKEMRNHFKNVGDDSRRRRKEGQTSVQKEIFKCKDSRVKDLYEEIMEILKKELENCL